jgi:hypothetical protein
LHTRIFQPNGGTTVVLPRIFLTAILAAAALAYWVAAAPERFGFYHDDALYVVTAKSLATGQGYRIISLPYEPAETKYPPLYPFLLSLIWRASPIFPANIPRLVALSAVAMLAFLSLVCLYLVDRGYAARWVAVASVAAAALNWRTVILATATLSEALYAALSVGVLWFAEAKAGTWPRRFPGLVLGIGMGLLVLTRTSGIALLVAVFVWHLIRRQTSKWLLSFCVASAIVLSWGLWVHANGTDSENFTAAYYTSYWRDWSDSLKSAGSAEHGNVAAFASLVGNQALRLMAVSLPVVCLGLDYRWHDGRDSTLVAVGLLLAVATTAMLVVGFVKQCKPGVRLLHLYVLCYLGLHLVWPYTAHDRFLMPLFPFLIVFLLGAITSAHLLVRKGAARPSNLYSLARTAAFGLLVSGIVLFALWQHASGLRRVLGPARHSYSAQASEDEEIARWIREHTGASDVLIGYRDPDYYLRTGRRMVRSSFVMQGTGSKGRAQILFRLIRENRARFLVRRSGDFDQDARPEAQRNSLAAILNEYPENFVPVFQTSSGRGVVYRISAPSPG